MTIVEAVVAVMRDAGRPMSAHEAYEAIASKQLYAFEAKHPVSVVHQQIRRHCAGVDNATSSNVKYFARSGDSRYALLPNQD